MDFERFNSSNQIDPNSVWSAKSVRDKGLQVERANQEQFAKEKAYEARAYETIRLQQATAEETKQLREQLIRSEESAKKREAAISRRNTAFNITGILIALASLAVSVRK